jgi:hypothetical protein
MTLPDGGHESANRISEMLAGFGDVDRAAPAVYCNSLTASSRTAVVMEVAA